MANDLLSNLAQYFAHVEKCDKNWNNMCDRLKSTLSDLKNQAKHLRAVKSNEADNLEIFYADVRMKLISKIYLAVETTIQIIKQELLKILNDNQELGNKLKNLEKVRSTILLSDAGCAEIINGTPTRPGLNVLMKFSLTAYTYHSNLYAQSKEILSRIDPVSTDSIENLTKSFCQDKVQRKIIDEILLYTQNLIKDVRR